MARRRHTLSHHLAPNAFPVAPAASAGTAAAVRRADSAKAACAPRDGHTNVEEAELQAAAFSSEKCCTPQARAFSCSATCFPCGALDCSTPAQVGDRERGTHACYMPRPRRPRRQNAVTRHRLSSSSRSLARVSPRWLTLRHRLDRSALRARPALLASSRASCCGRQADWGRRACMYASYVHLRVWQPRPLSRALHWSSMDASPTCHAPRQCALAPVQGCEGGVTWLRVLPCTVHHDVLRTCWLSQGPRVGPDSVTDAGS